MPALILCDAVCRGRNISIFSGFTRDVESIGARLKDRLQTTTILAPENSALDALPRKPWEDARDFELLGAGAYEGREGRARARKNLESFVNAHIVAECPWKEGHRVRTLAGKTIWYEIKDGRMMLQPDDVEIASIAARVTNGEVWIIKGTLSHGT